MLTDPAAVDFLRNLVVSGPALMLKLFFIVGVVMYGFFALVVIKQASIMTESIEENANGLVRLLTWVHFGLTVLVLVAAVLWL